MHFNLLTIAAAVSTVFALSDVTVENFCWDTKYLTLSTNEAGVVQYNVPLTAGNQRVYAIDGDHSLAVANTTDYWSPSTAKIVLGTNSYQGIIYYAIGLVNGNPLYKGVYDFEPYHPNCPDDNTPDGSTKACPDDNVHMYWALCYSPHGSPAPAA